MNELLVKGYAEKVPEEELDPGDGKLWYIPHHGVYHPTKGKIRVVFNCGVGYQGTSLNAQLLQSPDLTSSLIGVVSRFRKEPVVIMADIMRSPCSISYRSLLMTETCSGSSGGQKGI